MEERIRSLAAPVLSLCLLVAYGALLARAASQPPSGLAVVLLPRPGAVERAEVRGRGGRLSVDGVPRRSVGDLRAGPGVHLARWECRHLGRRPRVVGQAYVRRGADGGEWLLGAARVALAQRRLDGPAGDSLARALEPAATALLRRELRKLSWLQRKVIDLLVGAVREVRLALRITQTGVAITARVRLEHDGQRVEVELVTRLAAWVVGHRLELELAGLQTRVATTSKPSWWRQIRALVAGKLLSRYLPARAKAALEQLLPRARQVLTTLLSRRLALSRLRPPLIFDLRPARLEARPGRSLDLLFDVRVLGPVHRGSRGSQSNRSSQISAALPLVRFGGVAPRPSGTGASLSVDAINAVLAAIWRTGHFDALATEQIARAQGLLDARLRRLVAFDVREARLLRSPLWMAGKRHGLGVGPLRLTLAPRARTARLPPYVDLHGRLSAVLSLDRPRQSLHLALGLERMLSSCGEGSATRPLRPCFGELVGLASRWLRGHRPIELELGPGRAWQHWRTALEGAGTLHVRPTIGRVVAGPRGVTLGGKIAFVFAGR